MSTPTTFSGGAYSISATFADIESLAAVLADAAAALAGTAVRVAGVAAHELLATASALDPFGAATVNCLAARVGILTARAAAEAELLASGLRGAAAAYRACDDLRGYGAPIVRALAGLPELLDATVALPDAVMHSHPSAVQKLLTADPALLDVGLDVATAVPGLGGVPGAAAALGVLYRDGSAVLTELAPAEDTDAVGPPRTVTDLVEALTARNAVDDGGVIDIRVVTRGGQRAVIVDLPGTTRWDVLPAERSPQVSDWGTNLRALARESNVYERGVIEALQAAGVSRDEPIMIVGHSQGGVIGAQLAHDLKASGRFDVTHLVTAGSPIGAMPIPTSVSVLSLENRHDVVPQLDGRDNPDRRDWLTATFDEGTDDTVVGRHSLPSYLAGAADLDASDDRSLRSWRAGAGTFLNGDSVQTRIFQIRRR